MRLVRTRAALASASKEFHILQSVVDHDTEFRHRFVSFIGMMQRVGSILDDETKGRRTVAFGNWWALEKQNPTFNELVEVRNAEFKRGEDRKSAHHDIHLYDAAPPTDSVSAVVTRHGEIISVSQSPTSTPDPPGLPGPTHEVSWKFVGGGLDGRDVMALLMDHMKTLAAIVDRAEELL